MDGTAKVMINDNKYAATWTLENDTIHMVYEDGDTADISVTPDGLIYTAGNQTQYFGRMKAFINFFSTAEKCLEGGLTYLSDMAPNGYPKKPDYTYGITLFVRGAEMGSGPCAYMVGRMYADGMGGLPQDAEIAAEWYQKRPTWVIRPRKAATDFPLPGEWSSASLRIG